MDTKFAALKFFKENLSTNFGLINCCFRESSPRNYKKSSALRLTDSHVFMVDRNRASRGGEWYLEKRGSRKILAGSRNLGSVFDKSRSLVFSWFAFTFFQSRNFSPKSLGLGFLTRFSASRRVSDFTIRHPCKSYE